MNIDLTLTCGDAIAAANAQPAQSAQSAQSVDLLIVDPPPCSSTPANTLAKNQHRCWKT